MNELEEYIPDIAGILRTLNAARRQASLYEIQHPSTIAMLLELEKSLQDLFNEWGHTTFEFTLKDVVVNDRHFVSSDCQDLYWRLRVRGVMAVSFVGPPKEEELRGFLAFLNADPGEIREGRGPVEFLMKQGVVQITASEAVYTLEEASFAEAVECEETLAHVKVNDLFNAEPDGLRANLEKELKPISFIESAGNTLRMLMSCENSAVEHGKESMAVAGLISQAMGQGDMDVALSLAAILAKEATQVDEMSWRSENALAALACIDTDELKILVHQGVKSGEAYHREVASLLVSTLPGLALAMADALGMFRGDGFEESLREGIAKAGGEALPVLHELLKNGHSRAQESAIEVLVLMDTAASIDELLETLKGSDEGLSMRILSLMPAVHSQLAFDVCIEALHDQSGEVRCAALSTLSVLGNIAAVPEILKIATAGVLSGRKIAERVAAMHALGQLGGYAEISFLEKIACGRSFVPPNRHSDVRAAARQAAGDIRARLNAVNSLVA